MINFNVMNYADKNTTYFQILELRIIPRYQGMWAWKLSQICHCKYSCIQADDIRLLAMVLKHSEISFLIFQTFFFFFFSFKWIFAVLVCSSLDLRPRTYPLPLLQTSGGHYWRPGHQHCSLHGLTPPTGTDI